MSEYSSSFIHKDARIETATTLGQGCSVWAGTHIRENVTIGDGTSIGASVYIGPGVSIGKVCKIQNGAFIYEPSKISDGVFVGPGVIFTNDKHPRSVTVTGALKTQEDWKPVCVEVEEGASIGAGAICIAPIQIGEWAMIGAGAIVTKDVKPYSLVLGSPAKFITWVGKSGVPLKRLSESEFICPIAGEIYELDSQGRLSPR